MVALIFFSLWYLAISLAGWLTFPLTFRMLRGLPDCGYSITRILAWLLWGYLFWILATLGILRNEWSNILACLIILIGLSLWSLKGDYWNEFKGWVSSHRKFILVVEGVFFISFLIWAFIRATNPEALGTEKPMELAFINAILRAPTFPPHDPWLSGYSISYYHFGYILISMLAKFTGTSGGVAFNLGSALIFALAAVGVYGLVYNVLRSRLKTIEERKAALLAFWGPLFLLFFSNLEGFLHSLHNRGIFWRSNEAGEFVSKFWSWLDIQDLNISSGPATSMDTR